MNVAGILLWGFLATIVLTTLMAASQGLGISRMSIPYILGTIGIHYGRRTPFITLVAHVVYGAILGGFYRMTP